MAISDKEAFRILDLPLGVDKDAINQRYRTLTSKLAASKVLEDTKKLEKVVQAFHQLLPPPQNKNRQNNLPAASRSSHRANDDAANLSAMHALQRKAEKKKEKKKRKKEKKKSNDKPENKFIGNNGKIGGDDSDCSSYELDAEEEPLDINSAFVTCGRKMGNSNGAVGGAARKEDNATNRPAVDPEVMRNRQVQARGMAVQGNEAAAQGLHQKAVKLFTQAAAFDPSDHRFLGNRSFCYEQLKQYDRALSDADKAIELSSEWPKGYFRRGRALLGLGMLTEAEESFSRVLKLDPECQEAQEEICNVQRTRLTEMGFTCEQATQAISKYKQVQAALDALLAGEFHDATSSIFYSDGEEEADAAEPVRMYISAASLPKKPVPPPHQDDIKMNPKNPQGLTSLWVGNVLPEVTEKELQKLFSKHGHVSSVRQLKEKFCAFVNFTDSNSAGRAMTGLQGHTVSGQRLLIKFPDNPITANPASGSGGARRRNTPGGTSRQPGIGTSISALSNGFGLQHSILNGDQRGNGIVASRDGIVASRDGIVASRNGIAASGKSIVASRNNIAVSRNSVVASRNVIETSCNGFVGGTRELQGRYQLKAEKRRGPVDGDECYFWRTTGCVFATSCRHEHVPEHHGIDKKPWQKERPAKV